MLNSGSRLVPLRMIAALPMLPIAAVPVPGYFVSGTAASLCPAGSFCGGYSREAQPAACGPHMSSLPGAQAFSDCSVDAGYLWDANFTAAVPCWSDHYCLGGDQATAPVPCASHTTAAIRSSMSADCGEHCTASTVAVSRRSAAFVVQSCVILCRAPLTQLPCPLRSARPWILHAERHSHIVPS